jgi:hypothetical protein
MCVVPIKIVTFIFNSTNFQTHPIAIMDNISHQYYPLNLKSLLHLGAEKCKLFEYDFQDLNASQKEIELLGMPAISSLYPHFF